MHEMTVLQERGRPKPAQDVSRTTKRDRQALEEILMVNSVKCSTYIEQGQKGDFRFIYGLVDVREEADKQGFSGVVTMLPKPPNRKGASRIRRSLIRAHILDLNSPSGTLPY